MSLASRDGRADSSRRLDSTVMPLLPSRRRLPAPRRRRAAASRPAVVVLGDLVLDVVVAPDRALELGSDVTGSVQLRQGGSAATAARWLGRIGARSTLICAVGRDATGRVLVAALTGDGVTVRAVRVRGRADRPHRRRRRRQRPALVRDRARRRPQAPSRGPPPVLVRRRRRPAPPGLLAARPPARGRRARGDHARPGRGRAGLRRPGVRRAAPRAGSRGRAGAARTRRARTSSSRPRTRRGPSSARGSATSSTSPPSPS